MAITQIKDSIQRWNEVRNTSIGLNFLTSGTGLEIKRSEYEKWEDIRKTAEDEEIDAKDFQVHLYIGLVEFETTFYLVDSFSDANNNHEINENLFVKEFTKSTFFGTANSNKKTKIPPIELKVIGKNGEEEEKQKAFAGAFTWMLYSNTWFNNKQIESRKANNTSEAGVVRVFKIPFQDFIDLFEDKNTNNVFLFFGIKDYEATETTPEYLNEIELLLCSKQELKPSDGNKNAPLEVHIARDLTSPCPPFSIDDEPFNLL